MILKDTLKSYTDTPYAKMIFTDDDVDSAIVLNTKHFQASASSTSPQAKLKFFPNRLDRRDDAITFETSDIETVRSAYDFTPDTDKFGFRYYPDMDTDNTLTLKEAHIDNFVLAKAYGTTASYVWILTGAFELEKFLVIGTPAEIYTALTDKVVFTVEDGSTDPIEGASVTLAGYGTQTTDASGNTTFYTVIAGDTTYDVSATGFVTQTDVSLTVSSGSDTTETVSMTAS